MPATADSSGVIILSPKSKYYDMLNSNLLIKTSGYSYIINNHFERFNFAINIIHRVLILVNKEPEMNYYNSILISEYEWITT